MAEANEIRRRALRIEQDPKHPLYLFTMTGAQLLEIADISRVSRDAAGKLLGYQRTEVKKHVQNIVDYLNSGNVLFPNAIILALSSDVKFQ
ncbi:MAG: DGQHR domain-containing protein, partial [Planctomyces sp.]